ncbi:DUF2726 domain-containing protein [Serratia fonticola]|jgi:hypothetical protein
MFVTVLIIIVLLTGFAVLLRLARRVNHPLLQTLRSRGIRFGKVEGLLCRRQAFVSAGQLMTAREQRFLRQLERVTDRRQWRLCPQVRVADIVKVSSSWKSGSREWWQLFRLVAQWHCDVVITDRDGRIMVAVELDDRSHQALQRQRRDLLLEEVLRQAGIPLLRSEHERALVEHVEAFLATAMKENNV